MALFTDGWPSTIENLREYDTAVLDVAHIEGVDLSAKLAVAQRELAAHLSLFLLKHGAGESAPNVQRVVVTEPLQRWHALETLATAYRDVYHSQLNDRYLGKWKAFEKAAGVAAARLFELGIGMVSDPIPRAAPPEIESAPGAVAPGAYCIQVAWRNALGEEGAPSEVRMFTTEDGSAPVVKMGAPPANAGFWSVYAGPAEGTLSRQNAAALEASLAWTMPPAELLTGAPAGTGQLPVYYLRTSRVLQRG